MDRTTSPPAGPLASPASPARRRSLALLAALLLGATGGAARAATSAGDPDTPAPVSQRRFGFGATAGTFAGFGATVGGGGRWLQGWFSGGFMPDLIFANARTADKAVRFNYYSSYQINEDIAVRIFERRRLAGSLVLGYKYNSVFGHGGGAGIGVIYDLSPTVALRVSGGFAIFPSAKERLRQRGYPDDRDPALTVALQGGLNVGIIFFP